jgi:crotonobetainyl-CoA:carnitine CoA-transferase CaiB-like acyl-CoA transferase
VTAHVLDHIRVLDLTAWQAGPTTTMILADFGAQVLKIEAPKRLDGWRGGAGLMNDRAYERSPIWNAVNRNKLGLSLDLKAPEGRGLFLKLVEGADVVVENYTPRVMENFGLSYDVLSAVNPRIIMIALSGFGATGPWRDYSAFAFPTEEASGLTYLNGAPGGPPILVGQPVTDALAGGMGAFAILAALEKREKTGRGDYIDLSQIEALSNFIAPELIDAQANGREATRQGNSRPGYAPHGLFPCLPSGDWLAVAVETDAQWQSLCAVLGRIDLAADATLATLPGRLAASDRVREAIRAWTSGRDGIEAADELQAAGVPASVAMRPTQLLNDAQLWARNFFQILEREEVGTHPYPGPVVRLSDTPATFDRPAPLFGQHTHEILEGMLGLSAERIAELDAAGITSTTPADQDWR